MERLKAYIPMERQYLFHMLPAKERLISGGNQSGKTWAAAWDFAVHLARVYPDWYPEYNRWAFNLDVIMRLVGGNFYENIENIIVPMVEWWLEDSFPIKWTRRRGHVIGGELMDGRGEIMCLSEKQGLRAHEGATFHYEYVDEPIEERFYNAGLRGTMKYSGKMVMAQTPLPDILQSEWVDKRFPVQDEYTMAYDTTARIQLITTDNLFLKQLEVDHFATQMKRSSMDEYNARILGMSPGIMRQVIKEFTPHEHIMPTKKLDEASYYFGIDPHPHKGEAMAWVAVLPPYLSNPCPKVIVCDCFNKERFQTTGQIISAIKAREADRELRPVVQRMVDQRYAQNKNKETGNTFIMDFLKASDAQECPMHLIPARAKDIEFGNNKIRQMLLNKTFEVVDGDLHEVPELRVMDCCLTTIQAFYKYIWNKLFTKVEDNEWKDPMDVIRYILSCNLEYRPDLDVDEDADPPDDDDDEGFIQFEPL